MSVEPIAVIGLDCKYPCDGDTPEKFYEFLVEGRSARKPIPRERYNAEAFWHPDSHRDGVIGGKEAHFINANVKSFDAPFFSITPAEAACLDPQQRLLLECAYTAFESAGITIDQLQGSLTGVFVGSFIWDYRDIMMKDLETPMLYTGSGSIASTLAGRVSYFYNLKGPALLVDTACSSSMVSLHQAIVSLKQGDCDMALACGTNVILAPEMGLELNGLGVLDRTSTSYTYDERAGGYGRGEGIGAIVLKRMSDALRDGDTIRAVIRNSGSNQDGRSNGLTAPCKESQVDLMRKTYAQAGLDPSVTRFFEAHGTGTPTGDPIEASAISEMFSHHRSAEEPLHVGAVKTNVGHSEGASGIESVIKCILTVENGIIPANAWFKKANPRIPMEKWHFNFVTKALPWPRTENGVRRVSINSFGVSGTNAHIVMDDALSYLRDRGCNAPHKTVETPQLLHKDDSNSSSVAGSTSSLTNGDSEPVNGISTPASSSSGPLNSPQLFVLSSHDQDGISRLCNVYKQSLPLIKDSLYDLSYTLATKRTRFNWRAAIVADSLASLQDALSEKQQATRLPAETGLGIVFTGQGAQWARMGLELVHFPVFNKSIEEADKYISTLGSSWSALDELEKSADQSKVNEAELSQPLCTILQVALVDLLTSWGVTGRAVAGHSSGEIAAAYTIGAISKESAWKIAFWRGKKGSKLLRSGTGIKTTMAAVGLDLEKANKAIDKVHRAGFQETKKLTVACLNSKESQTISGDSAQIEALVDMLKEDGIFARKLNVELAYHSQYMEPMAAEYTEVIGDIQPGTWTSDSPRPQYFSSTYGTLIDPSILQEAAYWTKNLVSPVRFHEAMKAMLEDNGDAHLVTDILEVGPHAALSGPLRNIIDETRGNGAVHYHSILRRGASDLLSALQGAGSLFTRGVKIDLAQVNHVEGHEPSFVVGLPRYPFNHSKEYWCESRLSRNLRYRAHPRHELLGVTGIDWDGTYNALWRNWIRLSENPWVEHHVVSDAVLYPAAGMIVMAIEGCRQLAERFNPDKIIKGLRLREVVFHSAIRVPSEGVESHVYLRPVKQAALETKTSEWREFLVCTAQEDDEWREHCRGQILIEYEEADTAVDGGREEKLLRTNCVSSIDEARRLCTTQLVSEDVYDAWRKLGLAFGPMFQTVRDPFVEYGSGKAVAKVVSTVPILEKLMPYEYVQPHLIHPTTLDGIFQVSLAPLIADPAREQRSPVVVSFIDELWVSATQPAANTYYETFAETKSAARKQFKTTCTAITADTRQPAVLVRGLKITELEGDSRAAPLGNDPLHRSWIFKWKPDIELLTREETEKLFSTEGGLMGYLDALAHKSPSAKILEIGAEAGGLTKDILLTLGKRFSQYHIADSSPSLSGEKEKEKFPDGRVSFHALDLYRVLDAQGLEAKTYDTVIATIDLGIGDLDIVLVNVQNLLKPGGRLILTTSESTASTQKWATRLAQLGFTGIDHSFQDAGRAVMVSSMPCQNKESAVISCQNYFIVVDPMSVMQKSAADKLSSVLSARGQTVVIGSLDDYSEFALTKGQDDLKECTCILLPELQEGLLTAVTEEVLAALKMMMTSSQRILWVNKDGSPATDLVPGFAMCLRLERPDLDLIILTFQPDETVDAIAAKIVEIDTATIAGESPKETSYKVLDGVVNVVRAVETEAVTKHINKLSSAVEIADVAFGADPTRSLRLQIRDIGLLDTVYFDDDPMHITALADTEVEFRTMAVGVNFKDLAVMLGKIDEKPIGLEAAGIVTRVGAGVTRFKEGDRIFGLAYWGAFSTHVRGLEGTIAHIPEGLSFVDVAALPVVYLTAYKCLYDIGDLDKRVRRGKKPTVLIHTAAGGLGQAAIQLAQREGAEIFATVGSLEKRDFIEETYGIPRDHIFSSRDLTFKTGVMRMTNGRGVDIIINSLDGEKLRASWECIAPFGSFAEVGMTDIESRARIPMDSFGRGVRFEAMELLYMQQIDLGRLEDLFERTVASVLGQGLKRSTPVTTFSISHIQDALRHMQTGKHLGKLVIVPNENDIVPVVQPPKPVSEFATDATYVVAGGFGGLGQRFIRWMVRRGARNLIVLSRSGPKDASTKALIADLGREGVNVAAPACDITNKATLEDAISSCLANMPPARGCIQTSVTLADNRFSDMTLAEWRQALNVKVAGSRNLWETLSSRNADESLDFFVMLSSMISTHGNTGQANYGAGNSFQDAYAKYLASRGHNAVTINVPMMSDAGIIATKPGLGEYFLSIGWSHMMTDELIASMDYYCRPLGKTGDVTPEGAHVVPRMWLPSYTKAEGAIQLPWQHNPMFNHMVLHGEQAGKTAGAKTSSKGTTASSLESARSQDEAKEIVLEALLEKLTKVLSIDIAELDASRPMHVYGVDSLVAVELRTWMTKVIGSDVSVFEMTGGQRIEQIAAKAATTSRFVQLLGSA
ncbi:polyketide synthase [Xylaria cf. heliscus]|nr:polyketide synthase [Xylaria cf. heliscus]